ncbi:MAG: restriction endonuclease subunit M, partial [Prevotella sp.]|nr:restriction endonuclease subunit M [Prevotella sp.]
YDTTTGEMIPLENRIGLLDRKLRVVSENVDNSGEWLKWAQVAFKSTYGYEWQGDNLLLARENLLITFIDYYRAKFGRNPMLKSLKYIAYIVSWNLWQMDGLKGVIPDTSEENSLNLLQSDNHSQMLPFEESDKEIDKKKRIDCLIRDWNARPPKDKIPFKILIE